MSDEKLLKCPFCGSVPEIKTNGGSYGYISPSIYIECCIVNVRETTEKWEQGRGHYMVTKEAYKNIIKTWNKREANDD